MNCEEFRAYRLAGEEVAGMSQHLDSCAACRAHAADIDAGRMALRDPALWEEPVPGLAAQVEALLAATSREIEPRSPRRMGLALSAAAAVIAVVGLLAVTRSPAPDWQVEIVGTPLAAAAAGTVEGWNSDGGTRMRLRVSGLDPAPDGYLYEFWLSDGPIHISAGTFRSAEEVELWAGVTRADFPRLWVTLEPIDEDESPTDQTVLDTGA